MGKNIWSGNLEIELIFADTQPATDKSVDKQIFIIF